MDSRPIGVTDSGLGGISVLRSLVKELPDEKYVYYGDTANAPYGDKPEDLICELTVNCVKELLRYNAKAIVIACNTATSASVEYMRSVLPLPVIGVEPALKPAALYGRPGKILVMATTATLRQKKFQRLMEKYGENAFLLPCPGLMEFVERGDTGSKELEQYLRERFSAAGELRIGSVVLGCTHYVFLRDIIARILPDVDIFDGNEGTARQLRAVLTERNLLAEPSEDGGSVKYLSSDPTSIPTMKRMFSM